MYGHLKKEKNYQERFTSTPLSTKLEPSDASVIFTAHISRLRINDIYVTIGIYTIYS